MFHSGLPRKLKLMLGATIAIGGILLWSKTSRKLVAASVGLGVLSMVGIKSTRPQKRVVRTINDYCTEQEQPKKDDIDTGSVIAPCDVLRSRCVCKELPVGFSFSIDHVWVPRNCYHNEMNALVTRQLQKRLPMTSRGKQALREAGRMMHVHFAINPTIDVPAEEWMPTFLKKYPEARRKQILRMMENNILVRIGLKGFSKIETMVGKPCDKRKVRFISGFDDGYLAETGPEYYLWQKAMIKHYWKDMETIVESRLVYTGGMTADTIGEWFEYHCARLRVLLLLDFSKFDSRNKTEIMETLHKFYKGRLSDLLWSKLVDTIDKYGTTSQGIRFNVVATVASGRIDTSLGNTFITFLLVLAMMSMLNRDYLENMWVSALGDDNNTALTTFTHTMEDIHRVSSYLGHEADGMIVRPGEYHKLEYCSQRVWQHACDGRVLGPKIGRTLSKTFVCHKHVPVVQLEAHIAGVMQGFKNYRWIPVLRTVIDTWMRRHPGVVPKRYYDDSNPHKMVLQTELLVDEDLVIQQFMDVYGFHPATLEEWIETLPFDLGDTYTHPLMNEIMRIDGVSYEFGVQDWIHYFRQSLFH